MAPQQFLEPLIALGHPAFHARLGHAVPGLLCRVDGVGNQFAPSVTEVFEMEKFEAHDVWVAVELE